MSYQSQAITPIPEETRRIARAVFPMGCTGRLLHPARFAGSPITRARRSGLGRTFRPAQARIASVSARRIRRWIQRGILPAIPTQDGYLIAAADLAGAQAGAGQRSRSRGHWVTDTDMAADTTTATDADTLATVNPNARAQLEAIRDEWLAPLIAQIITQAERIGHLEAERDELRRRVEVAELALSTMVDRDKTTASAPPSGPTMPTEVPVLGIWRRLRRRWWG